MSSDIVGYLEDDGMTPQQVRDLLGPLVDEMEYESSPASDYAEVDRDDLRQGAERAILVQAQKSRKPPGKQVVVPSGVVNSAPQSAKAKVVRVDTEATYPSFRNCADGVLPEAASAEALDEIATREMLGERVGDIMDFGAASQTSLFGAPGQACVLCGIEGCGAVCGTCLGRAQQVLGLFDRGYASQVLGFGERGAASNIYGDMARLSYQDEELLGEDANEFYRLQYQTHEMLGDDFYRLPYQSHEMLGMFSLPYQSQELLGADGFYRLAHQLEEIIGDVSALAVPSTVYAEQIALSLPRASDAKHVSAWKRGDNIYTSVRVTGWDGEPRILTATTPYTREVCTVVGYAEAAGLTPSAILGVVSNLACRLGAGGLVPRLCAGSPAILRAVHGKEAPFCAAIMPVR